MYLTPFQRWLGGLLNAFLPSFNERSKRANGKSSWLRRLLCNLALGVLGSTFPASRPACVRPDTLNSHHLSISFSSPPSFLFLLLPLHLIITTVTPTTFSV
ncbi:hypothetical protein E2C01_040903 [Portunus trituberculatus]|uniref:Uncharacterized protein n=1 Tax=Portunus trituberculatus TaxID=210409 RepID=A0A5B7FP89_PORTR|nr:hypothetical protein [Portunus trituberculatus]